MGCAGQQARESPGGKRFNWDPRAPEAWRREPDGSSGVGAISSPVAQGRPNLLGAQQKWRGEKEGKGNQRAFAPNLWLSSLRAGPAGNLGKAHQRGPSAL